MKGKLFYHTTALVLILCGILLGYRWLLEVAAETPSSLTAKNFVAVRFALSLASLLAMLSYLITYREKLFAKALLVFLLSFSLYLPQNDISARQSNGGDCLWYIPTALSLLGEGNFELSEYREDVAKMPTYRVWINNLDYDPRLYDDDKAYYNKFPLGVSLSVLPLAFVGNILYGEEENKMERSWSITYFSAKCVAASTVALLFVFMTMLTSRVVLSFWLAALFAGATPQFSMHGAGLWSHSVVAPFLIVACMLLIAREGKLVWMSSIPLSIAYLVRPDSGIFIMVIALFVIVHYRAHFFAFATTGALFCIFFLLLSKVIYGSSIPSYYSPGRAFLGGDIPTALAGLLFSPNRGLFIYTPLYLISVVGLIVAFRSWRTGPKIYLWIGLMLLAHTLAMAYYPGWMGGHCYGPRRMANLFPFLVVMMIPALSAFRSLSVPLKTLGLLLALIALSWSIFVQYRGVSDWGVHEWNHFPDTRVYDRAWSWDDMQILRGWGGSRDSLIRD